MDYRNILEGTRPFFQGLPFPSSNAQSGNSQGTPSPLPMPQSNHFQLGSSSKESNSSNSIHPVSRYKYEEGLGAALSQMYSTRSPSLRTPLTQLPLSSSSPTIINGPNSIGPSPCSPCAPPITPHHHLALRGGSSSSINSVPTESTTTGSSTPVLLPAAPSSSTTKGNSNSSGVPQKMVVRRESPLDLSVKTVRQSADSSTNSNPPGERSVSSSGASTPNPEAMSRQERNTNNNVIAAVANSTTGRNPGKEAYIQSSTNSPMIPNHHSTPPAPPAPSSGIETHRTQDPSPSHYAYSQNHHLFSPHYPAAVAAIPSSTKPPLPYSHYDMSSTPRQSPAPASLSNSVSGSGPAITTSVASSSTPHPQHPSRPSSVIPPYNPPAPSFGVGLGVGVSMNPYGHQQPSAPPPPQSHPTQPNYHPQNPYTPYHQAHHHAYSYSPYSNHNGNNPVPTSNANNQQQLGNGNLSQYPPTSSYPPNNNPQQQQPEQSYGIPSHYPFQNYYVHPQQQQQEQHQQHHRPHQSNPPSAYPISQYANPPGPHVSSYPGALPVQYQHTQNRMPHSYYPYHNQPSNVNVPRRPPPHAPQQPPPTSAYSPFPPPHNSTPRLPAPAPPPPPPPVQQQQQQPSPAVSGHKDEKPPTKPRASSPTKQPKREKQSGGKRKDILDLLRNSVETRIHEKQEKEKTVVNHTSTNQAYWNFHGKKYPVPVPPPPASGSILTGMSHANASTGPQAPNNNHGLFGINQRSNFMESQPSSTASSLTQALSPNNDSLSRIRTKAEKKQVFPNLLSQIEQEHSMKQQQQQQQQQQYHHHQLSGGGLSTSTTSVFDFQDEEEDSKSKTLNLNRTKSPIPGAGPPPPSSIPIKPRKSGSKKFPNKNKENLSSIDSTIESCIAQAISESFEKPEKKEISVPSSSSVLNKVPPAIDNDNIDEFWATCDSFVNDLSANPTTIKSRRGGLWAKLKPSGSKVKTGKSVGDSSSTRGRNRIRRNSADVDQDFEIESSSEDEEEEAANSASESKSEVASIKSTEKPKNRRNSTDDQPPAKKRKRSHSSSEDDDSDKSGVSDENDSEEVPLKGTKVGKRTLRKRRAGTSGSLIGKSITRDSEESSSSDNSDSTDSGSVASFSISSGLSGSSNSDDSDSSSNSSDSSDDDDESNSFKSGRSSSGDENSDDSESKTKTKSKKPSRSNSRKGGRREKMKKGRRSTRSGEKKKSMKQKRKENKRRKSARKDENKKLRPKRTCAQAKIKDVSGGSEDERGSSGEEWIMRGELGKKKRRIVYGDGSEFRQPGWEEELIDFKKKLRMPSKLIRVAKPASLCSSTKSKDPDESGTIPTPTPNSTTIPVTPILKTPNKSIKENKTPATTPVKSPEPKSAKKTKGRPPKSTKTEINSKKELEKKDTPVKSDASTDTGKSPAKKGKTKDKPLEERREVISIPVLLPTPGKPGAKFNKKMSIKSVFGTVEPEIVEPVQPITPQIICVASSPAPSTTTTKKILRRNKFKSGFDYIRKKKKATPANSSTADGSNSTPTAPKRPKISQEKNMTEEDIQAEIRGWVLNKGLGETAIHRAARLGYPDVAAYCLEHDICSPNCKDNAGYSPLHETCIKGNLEVAKILLAYGANPSQAAPGGIRPLHEACENGQVELVRLLLSYGADPLLATYAGITPLELAEHHPKVKLLLEQHIKDVQGIDETAWEFRGSGPWAEANLDNGYDVTSSPPPSQSPDNSGDGFEFEASELPLPPIYMLHGSAPYIMMQDLVNYLGLPKDHILRNHSGAVLEELNSNDFLEEAHCRQLLGTKFRLNSSSDLLTLIKYDDTVKKMLNIESCTIK